jgi:polar amino acid transport system substrate-binding protein
MNKITPFLLFSLAASIVAVWYLASKSSTQSRQISEKTLIVGTNSEYAPFSFMENGSVAGFDIDLVNEIAHRLGKTVDWHDMPFDSLIPALQTGSIQVLASGITPTPERAERVIFTKLYLTGDPLLIVSPANKPLTTVEQLTDKQVAVNEGFTADYYLAKIEGPILIRFASPIESFMALDSNRVDALVSAQNNVKPFVEHYGKEKFSIAAIPGTTDQYALAISKKYPELLEPIQKALDDMQADGTIDALKKKWLD